MLLATGLGARRARAETRELRNRLDRCAQSKAPELVDFVELEGLPAPVQRFFRATLTEGNRIVRRVRMQQSGTFNLGEESDRWKPFTADQSVVTGPPGFDWSGRIQMLPALSVLVHDAYVEGEGILHAAVLGLFTVANLRGGGPIAEGELVRYLAEAAWYPTALLPSQGVTWEALDADSAAATLSDRDHTVSLVFTFDANGQIATVRAESRARSVRGDLVPTPWQGKFWNYAEFEGVKVPQEGEVAWLVGGGAKPYWRGRLMALSYDGAQASSPEVNQPWG
jgi:hypothetical protein